MALILAQCLMSPVFAIEEEQKLYDNQISITKEQEKELILNDIKEQLIEQGRLGHLKFYEDEIDNRLGLNTDSNENILREAQNGISFLRASGIKAPRGGVGINSNSYATTTYIYIPNNMIDKEIAKHPDGISSWIAKIGLGQISIINGFISAVQTSQLRNFRDKGKAVEKIVVVDHTENDVVSTAYMEWKDYPYMSSNYDKVRVR